MGIVIELNCPGCDLKSGHLYIGSGGAGIKYAAAWCSECQAYTTVQVISDNSPGLNLDIPDISKLPKQFLLDDRSIAIPLYFDPLDNPKPRCLTCHKVLVPYDLKNRPCPVCGYKLQLEHIAVWYSFASENI